MIKISTMTSAFFVGCCIALFAPTTSLSNGLILCLLALTGCLFLISRLAVLLFLLSVGIAYTNYHIQLSHQRALPVELESSDLILRATIKSLSNKHHNGFQFDAQVNEIENLNYVWRSANVIRVYWPLAIQQPKVGQQWRLVVKLRKPRRYANPGSFDVEKHYFCQRIQANAVVQTSQPAELIDYRWYRYPVNQFRQYLRAIIAEAIPQREFLSVVTSLVLGEKSRLTEMQKEIFQLTGTAHLMAISGLHVGLVAVFCHLLGRRLFRLLPVQWLKKLPAPIAGNWFALLGSGLYALMAGFSYSTQRALIMICCVLFSQLRYRHIQPQQTFWLALLFISFCDPFAPLSAGFWLSFGAVAVLLICLKVRHLEQSKWNMLLRVQWYLGIGMAPLTLYFFQQLSWVAPIANLIAVPMLSFLVVPALLIITFWAAVGSVLNWHMGVVSLKLGAMLVEPIWSALNVVLTWLAKFQASWPIHYSLDLKSTLFMTIGCVWLLAPKGFPAKWVGLGCFLPALFPCAPILSMKQAAATVLDVGQGLASVIQTKNHVLVYDTGPKSRAGFDAGEKILSPYLQYKKIKQINHLMISHADLDHIGGAEFILKHHQVDNISMSDPYSRPQWLATACRAGQQWIWDGVEFQVLYPFKETSKKKRRERNDHSCVLLVQAGQQKLLLTGDIEKSAEQEIIKRYPNLKVDILLAPHHGSKSSSTQTFLKQLQPKAAIISAGYKNRYHHPHPSVMKRYQSLGVELYNTIQHGAITYHLSGDKKPKTVECYRFKGKRVWHEN